MPLPPDTICVRQRRARKRVRRIRENCRISVFARNAPERRQSAFGSRVDRHHSPGEAISATMRFLLIMQDGKL